MGPPLVRFSTHNRKSLLRLIRVGSTVLTARNNLLSQNLQRFNAEMGEIRRLSSVAGINYNGSLKRPKLSAKEYNDLANILSDSDDDWLSDGMNSSPASNKKNTTTIASTNGNGNSPLRNLQMAGTNSKSVPKFESLQQLPTLNKDISNLKDQSSQKDVLLKPPPIHIDLDLEVDIPHPSITENKPGNSKNDEISDIEITGDSTGPSLVEMKQQDVPNEENSIIEQDSLENLLNHSGMNNTYIDDEKSLESLHEQKTSKWGGKIALQTQIPNLNNVNEKDSELIKLAPNTKIKIPIFLSKEQENIIDLASKGYNIFYTGSAGTGKSVLLKEMIKTLKKKYGNDEVAVTASTGLAACNIGGFTVHSFAGIGLGKGEPDKLYKKVRRSRKHLRRWEQISALVIDEISMLDGELIDKLDYIGQKIRKNHQPFGGIQVIFCGDFFQLPPVSKDPQNPMKFAFESNAWKNGIQLTIMLQKVFRQQGDTKFIDMLNKMRLGKIDDETEREFKLLNRSLPDDDIIPAELYSTRIEVDRANSIRLQKLPGKPHTFNAIDGGSLEDEELKQKLLQNFLAPKQLQLKIGAQVMMIKNVDATLVNGSLGKIIDFIDRDTYMFYETMTKNPELTVSQLESLKSNPSQLLELYENEENNEENANQQRQKLLKEAYCKYEPQESMTPLGESIFDFLEDQDVRDNQTRQNLNRKKALLRELHTSSQRKKLPLVRFKTSDMSSRTVLVEPEDWAIEDENEKQLVSRVQIPLMLAWSLSIHKSQGQTLPKVKVDLRRVFEKGQAYVALSRAVSRDGLQVLNFDKTRVGAHQKVIDFYMTLVSAEKALEQTESFTDANHDMNSGSNRGNSRSRTRSRSGSAKASRNSSTVFERKLQYAPAYQQNTGLDRAFKKADSTSTSIHAHKSKSTDSAPFGFGPKTMAKLEITRSGSITDLLSRNSEDSKRL